MEKSVCLFCLAPYLLIYFFCLSVSCDWSTFPIFCPIFYVHFCQPFLFISHLFLKLLFFFPLSPSERVNKASARVVSSIVAVIRVRVKMS